MAKFVASTLSIDSEILQLLELISRKQGELSANKGSISDNIQLETMAAIDAIHFSTKIEGNSLSRDQVTRAVQSNEKVKGSKRDLREVLNYSRARRMVKEWSLKGKPFNDEWVLTHHAEVLKGILNGRLRGHYREAQCAIKDSRTHAIIYMAPEWKDVPLLMKGLLAWLRQEWKSGTSPLLLAAQFHFEFVTIHPFMDGNGRLARLLTNGILRAGFYEVERYAALEKQHEQDRAAYYRAMRRLQAHNFYDIPKKQDIRTWVVYWMKCLRATYEEALHRIDRVAVDFDALSTKSLEDRLKRAESLFRRHRKLRASDYADLVGLARTQAVGDLNLLVKAGFLERLGGGRSTVYSIRNSLNQRER